MTQTQVNPFLLAADNSTDLLPLLRRNKSLAAAQDAHGYSLVHAATSYNHLDLLRTLVSELSVPVDLMDEDGETALFVCETVECARILVEELHADTTVKAEDGKTAKERIGAEGEFLDVAAYLLQIETSRGNLPEEELNGAHATIINQATPLPEGLSIDIGTMAPEDIGSDVVDTEFKRRIEELATRGDFQGEEGQRELRELITEAVRGQVGQDRDIKRRTG